MAFSLAFTVYSLDCIPTRVYRSTIAFPPCVSCRASGPCAPPLFPFHPAPIASSAENVVLDLVVDQQTLVAGMVACCLGKCLSASPHSTARDVTPRPTRPSAGPPPFVLRPALGIATVHLIGTASTIRCMVITFPLDPSTVQDHCPWPARSWPQSPLPRRPWMGSSHSSARTGWRGLHSARPSCSAAGTSSPHGRMPSPGLLVSYACPIRLF